MDNCEYTKNSERLDYFDVAKGLSMICIILGHFGIDRVNSFVFTFHVPVLFLISGYFLSDKLSICEYTKKRSRQLLIPYAVTCFFIIAGVTSADILRTHGFANAVANIKNYVIASLYGSGTIEYTDPFYMKQIGAIWFLLALFWALIITRFLIQYKNGVWAGVIIAYVGYKMTEQIWLPFSLQAGMTAVLFVYVGYLAKKHNLLEKRISPVILGSMAGIWLYCILFCGRLYLVVNHFENGLLDIIGAFCGSCLIILFSKLLAEKTKYIFKILQFYGKHSLTMLCLHAFELSVFSWEWAYDLFGEKLHFQYFTVMCFVVLLKLLYCAAGIKIVLFLKAQYSRLLAYAEKRRDKNSVEKKMPVSNGRLQYWDIAKGITILAVILGHVELPGYLRNIIFSFHMPLFIIANGYFIKSYDVKNTLKRSAKTLLCPYITVCMISALIYMFYVRDSLSMSEAFFHKMKAMIGGMSKMSTRFQSFDSVWLVWFVCCLFLTRNIYVMIMQLTKSCSSQVRIGIILGLAAFGYIVGVYYAFLPWSLDVALVSLVFIAFGNWLRISQFLQENYFYTLVVPLAIWVYFLRLGVYIELATRSYPLGFFSVVEAIAGSMVIISISKILSGSEIVARVFGWIGKHSMLILGIHCLELMYWNWDKYIYAYLPFSLNWFRIFVVKTIVILSLAGLLVFGKYLIQACILRKKR